MTRLSLSDGQVPAAALACLATSELDRVSAEGPALAGREERIVGQALALFEPLAQNRDGLGFQRDCALLASLAPSKDVGAGCEAHVADAQADQLGGPQPGLDRDQQERVVATAVPAAAVRRGEQRPDLGED